MYCCKDCGSAYLDPRPTPETIGLAYSNYFTHNFNSREDLSNLSLGYRIRRILANGYLITDSEQTIILLAVLEFLLQDYSKEACST